MRLLCALWPWRLGKTRFDDFDAIVAICTYVRTFAQAVDTINLYEIRGWASKSQMAKEKLFGVRAFDSVPLFMYVCGLEWKFTMVQLRGFVQLSAFTNIILNFGMEMEIMKDARHIRPNKTFKCSSFAKLMWVYS